MHSQTFNMGKKIGHVWNIKGRANLVSIGLGWSVKSLASMGRVVIMEKDASHAIYNMIFQVGCLFLFFCRLDSNYSESSYCMLVFYFLVSIRWNPLSDKCFTQYKQKHKTIHLNLSAIWKVIHSHLCHFHCWLCWNAFRLTGNL